METAENKIAAKRPWWNLGLGSWFGIAVLAVIGFFIVTGQVPLRKTEIVWAYYSLNPRTWSPWVAIPFWFAVLLQYAHRRFGPPGVFVMSMSILLLAIISVVAALLYLQFGMQTTIGKKNMLTVLYSSYLLSPVDKLMQKGIVDWKLFVAPMLGFFAIGLIAFLCRYQKKHDIRIAFKPRYDIHWMFARILRGILLLAVLGGLITVIVFMASEMNSTLPMRPNKNPVSVYYHKNILTPWSDFFNKGTFDRKLLVMPGAGAVLIALLLSMKSRRKPS